MKIIINLNQHYKNTELQNYKYAGDSDNADFYTKLFTKMILYIH